MSAKETKIIEVDGIRLRITSPNKVLFPEKGYTKWDLVQYYLAVKDELLYLNQGRPVVFIRYPHGIGSYSFFQKNVPDNHPDWMEVVEMGKHKPAKYLILNKIADLIWFIQLYALEFHIINVRKPAFLHPDVMVFDLDPPPDVSFADTRDFALRLGPLIAEQGYHVFYKTSGKKGIHLVCPIVPQYSVDQVFEAAEDIARRIVEKFPDLATTEVRKDKRGRKFLIDIYRNRAFQTFSMPLGTRATPQASVSMPLTRDQLRQTDDPYIYNIITVPEILEKEGLAWKDFYKKQTPLHLS